MNPGILEKILNETLAYKCIVMHFQYQSLGLRQIIVAALKITSDYYKNPHEWSNFTLSHSCSVLGDWHFQNWTILGKACS